MMRIERMQEQLQTATATATDFLGSATSSLSWRNPKK